MHTVAAVWDITKPRDIPAPTIGAVALGSVAVVASGLVLGWPAWAFTTGAIVPWVPIFVREVTWTRRNYGWLALFFVLVVTQGGHMLEHVVQMVQLHVLHTAPPMAKGVFGPLNIEWVHFGWNTWVLLVLAVLIAKFPRNGWLLVTFALASWHELEHAVILSSYLSTGMPGSPGLLAEGGKIAGGLPIARPDLHFFYNLIETLPLFIAFGYQAKREHGKHTTSTNS